MRICYVLAYIGINLIVRNIEEPHLKRVLVARMRNTPEESTVMSLGFRELKVFC